MGNSSKIKETENDYYVILSKMGRESKRRGRERKNDFENSGHPLPHNSCGPLPLAFYVVL